ncbi:putative phosphatidylserine decarboxylase [Xylaria nigripes]|nr:putative phosphatidylserine decarboxylase [Xylaria nigripes]
MPAGIYAPIVQQLVNKVALEGWLALFEQAVKDAVTQAPVAMQGISTLGDFYDFIDNFLIWVPFEGPGGREIYRKLAIFYFVFGRDSVYPLQTPIHPTSAGKPLSWLSDWLVRYTQEMGKFLDTTQSLTPVSLQSFKDEPRYRMHHYVEPHGGWKTFNQFFARYAKPGYRPIADIGNSEILVSPADSTFKGQWTVDSDSMVDIKGLTWSISELLKDSKYKDEFKGGIFTHSFLATNDYHRMHAPAAGKVLEVKLIQGQVFLDVSLNGEGGLLPTKHIEKPIPVDAPNILTMPNKPGYQFCQMRALFVLETEVGLVAVLPIGMAQVSSVIPTAEVGRTLNKGEELAYFQFGGSDIVTVFQARSKVNIEAQVDEHYDMGMRIATASRLTSQ